MTSGPIIYPNEHYRDLFADVGMCAIEFQKIEDSLPHLFACLIEPEAAAFRVFRKVIKQLSAKIDAIQEAIPPSETELAIEFRALGKRIVAAADERAELAHGMIKIDAQSVSVVTGADGSVSVVTTKHNPPRPQIAKIKRNGKVSVWDRERLAAFYLQLVFLDRDLTEFLVRLMERRRRPASHPPK